MSDRQPQAGQSRRFVVVLTEEELLTLLNDFPLASARRPFAEAMPEDEAVWQMREAIQYAAHKPGESPSLAKAKACFDALDPGAA